MDRKNAEVFSPIRNIDEEKSKRRTDSFSKFLKGPDVFKKISELSENVDENAPVKKNSSKKSSKTLPKKTAKSEKQKSEEVLGSSASINNSVFFTSSEENNSLKKDKSENLSFTSKRNKDIAINFITKRSDKVRTNQQDEVEYNKGKYGSHSAKTNSVKLVESSLESGAAIVSKASVSEEIKKTDETSSVSQRYPLSQIQSGVFEKLINDAVESRFEDIQELLYSQHFDLQKTLYNIMEKMEERHASDQATLFKVIEALLEENRSLRNAILACQ